MPPAEPYRGTYQAAFERHVLTVLFGMLLPHIHMINPQEAEKAELGIATSILRSLLATVVDVAPPLLVVNLGTTRAASITARRRLIELDAIRIRISR